MSEENKRFENENELPLEEEIKQEKSAKKEGMTYEEAQKYTGVFTSRVSDEQPPKNKEKKTAYI